MWCWTGLFAPGESHHVRCPSHTAKVAIAHVWFPLSGLLSSCFPGIQCHQCPPMPSFIWGWAVGRIPGTTKLFTTITVTRPIQRHHPIPLMLIRRPSTSSIAPSSLFKGSSPEATCQSRGFRRRGAPGCVN
ncbi:Inhibin beta B chain [Trichinella spiralis]|uniref:Inhibin beta B chain n=1 Tax=Trichinella spiralis TaxID=6334 RepID=A0ABR3KC08_TRISP